MYIVCAFDWYNKVRLSYIEMHGMNTTNPFRILAVVRSPARWSAQVEPLLSTVASSDSYQIDLYRRLFCADGADDVTVLICSCGSFI